MTFPILFVSVADVPPIGSNTAVTLGFVGTIIIVAGIIGEARWQVAHLREWRLSQEAEVISLRERLSAVEIREGRMLERLDALADRLNRIESKLDKVLERREAA